MITDIYDLYKEIREEILDGDIFFFRSRKPIGRVISHCDKSISTHVGTANWKNGRLHLLHSTFTGVDNGYLSIHIKDYESFRILRPNRSQEEIRRVLDQIESESQTKINYDLKAGIAALSSRWCKNYLGINVNIEKFDNKNLYLCSEFERKQTDLYGMTEYSEIPIILPDDFWRYRNDENLKVFFDSISRVQK